jgi:hypothetical protein
MRGMEGNEIKNGAVMGIPNGLLNVCKYLRNGKARI